MIVVTGESLIDMISVPESERTFRAAPGGSPFNVAMALGRQDVPVRFLGQFSEDHFGRLLRATLEESQVDLQFCPTTTAPSTIGFAHPHRNGDRVDYTFYTDSTAGCALLPTDCPTVLPEEIRLLHFGSFSLGVEPIASTVDHLLTEEVRGDRIVSIDPNIRTFLIDDDRLHRERLAQQLNCADIIKLSDEDLAWLHPEMSVEACTEYYLERGARLVAVTRGSKGAFAATESGSAACPTPDGEVVDTVGAGDTFQASLLAWLIKSDRLTRESIARLHSDELLALIKYAARAAAINCTRAGCNPPWSKELPE